MRWWIAFVMLACAAAQPRFPLEIIRVQGNKRIPKEKIVAVAGLKIGTPVVKEDFDAARARLIATGAFESVGYEYKPTAAKTGYEGVFDVVEVDQVYPYRFEDLAVPESALRAALLKQEPILGDQIPATKEVLERYVRVVQGLVGGDVKVIGKLSTDLPGQLAIVFRPDTPRPRISEVRFTGNDVIPAPLLTKTLSGVAIGAAYTEPNLRLLLDSSIRPLYDARGRILVTFPKIATEKAKNNDGVVVTITVNEGPSFNLGKVKFTGVAGPDIAELEKTAAIRKDDIANFDDIRDGLDRIYARYRNKGYLKVSGRVDRNIHEQEHTVDVTITVEPGAQYSMGKLEIVGLDLTSEPAIRKAWALKSGAPFQPEYPDQFLHGLREEGVFDNLGKTESEVRVDDKTRTVDVTLKFAGAGPEKKKKKEPQPW